MLIPNSSMNRATMLLKFAIDGKWGESKSYQQRVGMRLLVVGVEIEDSKMVAASEFQGYGRSIFRQARKRKESVYMLRSEYLKSSLLSCF